MTAGMTPGDGLACLAIALAAVGMAWAVAWCAVRTAAIRDEALRRPESSQATWTAKKGTR